MTGISIGAQGAHGDRDGHVIVAVCPTRGEQTLKRNACLSYVLVLGSLVLAACGRAVAVPPTQAAAAPIAATAVQPQAASSAVTASLTTPAADASALLGR
jgi:hypothetical protein